MTLRHLLFDGLIYYEIDTGKDDIINYDLKLSIKCKKLKFYSWFNLWFNTYEIISQYIVENNYFESETKIDSSDVGKALFQIVSKKNDDKGKTDILSPLNKIKNLKGVERANVSKAFGKIFSKYKEGNKKNALDSIRNVKDLNAILDILDDLAREKGVPLLDRNHLEFVVERKYLDKLKTELQDDFKIKYTYELLQ